MAQQGPWGTGGSCRAPLQGGWARAPGLLSNSRSAAAPPTVLGPPIGSGRSSAPLPRPRSQPHQPEASSSSVQGIEASPGPQSSRTDLADWRNLREVLANEVPDFEQAAPGAGDTASDAKSSAGCP